VNTAFFHNTTMAFLGVYRAVYDYTPVGDGELTLTEGDLLFVLEKNSEDNWWKAKKKSNGDDAEEPEGLIPNNYVEEVNWNLFGFGNTVLTLLLQRRLLLVKPERCMTTRGRRTKKSPSPKTRSSTFTTPRIRIGR